MGKKDKKRKQKKEQKEVTSSSSKGKKEEVGESSTTRSDNDDGDNTKKQGESSSLSSSSLPLPGSFRSIQPPLCDGVLQFLDTKNFHTMTPVQEATIPLFLKNKDVAVQAVTGSGKTLSFLIPIVERIRLKEFKKNQIAALILSPTRELAMQTWRVCSELCETMGLSPPLLLVGGGGGGGSSGGGSSGANHRPVQEDLKCFHKDASDIVIGTPGRMEDVLARYNVIDVSELEILVLDEADVLLFGKAIMDPTIASILNRLPKMRRTGIFSATTTFTSSKSVKPLLQRAGMRNPVLVNVQVAAAAATAGEDDDDDASNGNNKKSKKSDSFKTAASKSNNNNDSYTPTTLTNYYMVTKLEERISRLASFLQSHREEKMIVFFLTCACVDFFGSALRQVFQQQDGDDDESFCIELLHGKLAQKRREKAMERYRESVGGALFSTDVAARGLDVPDVDWVVQVDPPQDPSQFVHRVGRSARAGRKGSSLVFLTEREEAYVDLLANRKVTLTELPENELCQRPILQASTTTEGDDERQEEEETSEGSTIPDILPDIRGLVLKDRDMLEKGTKAFTSYIRAYKEHVCAFIFRFNSLDLGHLATAFCLLRLPKMPELNHCKGKLKHFTGADASVNIYKIPYLDKAREAARQKRLAAELAAGGKNAKQIKAEMKKAELLQKQKERRQTAIKKGRNPDKKRGRNAQIVDEWEDLAKEERLYKKLRRGKITKEQYEDLLRGGTGIVSSKASKNDDAESSDDE